MKKRAYYHLPGLFEFYELYRVFLPLFGNIENISMTGARLVQYTGLRQTVSGAVVVLPLERQTRKKYWI